jgi:NitT/TauT family transport system ATP-binding protein
VRNVAKIYDGTARSGAAQSRHRGGRASAPSSAHRAAASRPSCACCCRRKPSRGEILIDGETLPPEPTPDRGIVFQRYSVFPHLTVEENLMLSAEFDAAPLTGRLFGSARAGARRRDRDAGADRPGAGAHPLSGAACRAACSSASPLRRRC